MLVAIETECRSPTRTESCAAFITYSCKQPSVQARGHHLSLLLQCDFWGRIPSISSCCLHQRSANSPVAPGETAAITINSDAYIYKETFRTGLDLFTLFKTELKLTWQQKKKPIRLEEMGAVMLSVHVCVCAHIHEAKRGVGFSRGFTLWGNNFSPG